MYAATYKSRNEEFIEPKKDKFKEDNHKKPTTFSTNDEIASSNIRPIIEKSGTFEETGGNDEKISDNMDDNKASKYLEDVLGDTLTEVLTECAMYRPDDPISFLADAFERYRTSCGTLSIQCS